MQGLPGYSYGFINEFTLTSISFPCLGAICGIVEALESLTIKSDMYLKRSGNKVNHTFDFEFVDMFDNYISSLIVMLNQLGMSSLKSISVDEYDSGMHINQLSSTIKVRLRVLCYVLLSYSYA